jgi:hypothetical protein
MSIMISVATRQGVPRIVQLLAHDPLGKQRESYKSLCQNPAALLLSKSIVSPRRIFVF